MSLPRYAEYKNCDVEWLGPIPAHWQVLALSRVLQAPVTDGPHLTPTFLDEGIPFLSVDGIQDGELVFEGCRFISQSDHLEFSRKAAPRVNDILMGKAASIGKIARVKTTEAFSIWSPLALIRVSDELCLPAFAEYALKSPGVQAQVTTLANSNTQLNIGMKDIPKLRFSLPPLREQTAIATFLDRETGKIDALIAEQEKLLALLAEKRQATISHAVTKGMNPDVPMKDSGLAWLGEVPVHWGLRQLKTVSAFTTSGPRGWSDRISEDGNLFIQSGDLNEAMGVEFSNAKRVVVENGAEAMRTQLSDGDVVVCITGAKTGNVAVCSSVPEPSYVNQHLCLIRPDEMVYPSFLAAQLKSRVGQVQFELSQYGLKQGLSLENVCETLVVLPPLQEQEAIAAFINTETAKIDALKAESARAIALLKERRSALIAAAVTGQIDVRQT